ncbi:DNA primase [Flavobacterium sp. MC2016-06]|uniref:DNA primase n=1 Tax=Flavobacterium sp. MC2016-06 TaxID=2676308 RepID=UPI0012BB0C53|nr:DNA primase [Flavobacterium sp. MC2016-06]MBU3861152.1 DNA primase [Flavobacterium sp. MC2016-06]
MKRVIVDYAKLTNEILNLLVEKFPDGYDDSDVIRFRNAKNELIEAVEVRTEDTIYLVKISTKLADRIENYDEDDDLDVDVDTIEPVKGLDLDDDIDDDDEDDNQDKPDVDGGDGDDDDDDDKDDIADDDDDEDDED